MNKRKMKFTILTVCVFMLGILLSITGSIPAGLLAAEPGVVPSPFIDVVPSEDGTELLVQARGLSTSSEEVLLEFEATETTVSGPTGHRGCYSMTFAEDLQAHVVTITGFTAEASQEGNMYVQIDNQASATTPYTRNFVETVDSGIDVRSDDGNFQLTFISEETVDTDLYVTVASNGSLPAPAPEGHKILGLSYSVRASGATVATTKPMNLRLLYNEAVLGSTAENSLAIFQWNGAAWIKEGGRVFTDQNYVSIATNRFGTYALMAVPEWADDFDDASGLDLSQTSGVQLGSKNGSIEVLRLESGKTEGVAVSLPITPPETSDSWGMVSFEIEMMAGVNDLTIDVLDANSNQLLTDVVSDTPLQLNIQDHPALRLQANFSTTDVLQSPRLDSWGISWIDRPTVIYLPYITLAKEE